MTNNTQMVSVPRELLETIEQSWRVPAGCPREIRDEVGGIIRAGLEELRKLLAAPAEDVRAMVDGPLTNEGTIQQVPDNACGVRSPKDYAVEHAGYLAAAADSVQDAYKAYSLAQMNVDEGGDDGEGELSALIDDARENLHEALHDLRNMAYEFRKRSARAIPQ